MAKSKKSSAVVVVAIAVAVAVVAIAIFYRRSKRNCQVENFERCVYPPVGGGVCKKHACCTKKGSMCDYYFRTYGTIYGDDMHPETHYESGTPECINVGTTYNPEDCSSGCPQPVYKNIGCDPPLDTVTFARLFTGYPAYETVL